MIKEGMTKIELIGHIKKTSHSDCDCSWNSHEFFADGDVHLEDAFDKICHGWYQKAKITIEILD